MVDPIMSVLDGVGMGEAICHPSADIMVVALLSDCSSVSRYELADFASSKREGWISSRLGHLRHQIASEYFAES